MSATVTFGADLSQFQGALSISALAKQGFEFFAAKCTEGAHTFDSTYPEHLRQAKREGALFNAYHFLHSDSSAEAQAANLAAHIIDKSVRVMVDCEVEGNSRPDVHTAEAFRKACAKHGIKVTIIYDPHFWWAQTSRESLKGWHLWQAEYPFSRHEFASVLYNQTRGNQDADWGKQGGVVPTIWQFASSAKVSGYSGNVDVDAFRGTRDDLAATGIFTDFGHKAQDPARKGHPKHHGPSRVARVHNEYLSKNIVDVGLLDHAVAHGRRGTVRHVRDGLVHEVHKIPHTTRRLREIHRTFKRHRIIDMDLVESTALHHPRVHRIFHNIQTRMAHLPNR